MERSPNGAPPIEFIYFDLGRVLVHFDLDRMLVQIGRVAGIEPRRVAEIIFHGGLQSRYERGEVGTDEFFEEFCRRAGVRPDRDAMIHAACDIFWLNAPIVPMVARLRAAGRRLGILSNTCEIHWNYCLKRFAWLPELFDVRASSFAIGAMKPEPAIFLAAARLAGCEPRAIFFTDDIAEHVDGARAVGFNAVRFTSAAALADELRRRGIPLG